MSKRVMLGAAILAVVALSAVIVSAAYAEEEEVGANWLAKGAAIVGVGKAATVSMEMLVTELNNKNEVMASILCSMLLDGTVGPGAEDLITEMLNLDTEKIEGLSGSLALLCEAREICETGTDTELWPINLPWETLLDRMNPAGTFLDHIHVLFEYQCLLFGVSFISECEGLTSGEMLNVAGGVEPMFSAAAGTQPIECKKVAKSGILETEESPLITLNNGEALSVS